MLGLAPTVGYVRSGMDFTLVTLTVRSQGPREQSLPAGSVQLFQPGRRKPRVYQTCVCAAATAAEVPP